LGKERHAGLAVSDASDKGDTSPARLARTSAPPPCLAPTFPFR
jgi:hypothetical protein